MIITDNIELKTKIQNIANRCNICSDNIQQIQSQIQNIIDDIRQNGFVSVQKYTQEFDKITLAPDQIEKSTEGHFDKLNNEQKKAIQIATERVREFNQASMPKEFEYTNANNDSIKYMYNPIDTAGIYIPGGTAPLLSTVIMTAVLAQVVGVKKIILMSPPLVHDYILAVCDYIGIESVFQIGGVQAIASMAFGLSELSLPPVDKIYGPGNIFVTLAKKAVFGIVGIDSLYGPSELLILADDSFSPRQIAIDLISQLEHGSGLESGILLTDNINFAHSVQDEFYSIIDTLPKKEQILSSWNNNGLIGIISSWQEAIEYANYFAPEHLELKFADAENYLPLIKNAGAIFMGHSNEAFGDYLAGASHCLPTGRSARFSSGLSVYDFLKRSSITNINITDELVNATATLARMEGLEAHALSALFSKVL